MNKVEVFIKSDKDQKTLKIDSKTNIWGKDVYEKIGQKGGEYYYRYTGSVGLGKNIN